MNFSKLNGFLSNQSIRQLSVHSLSLSSNKLQCMDEGEAADILLELIQFQEAYVASENFRNFICFHSKQINQKLEFS